MEFRVGDKVILKKPYPNYFSPTWLDEMDIFEGKTVTLAERELGYQNGIAWKIKEGTNCNYSFREAWMTLALTCETTKEKKMNTESKITGPAVKTNDFPTWESHETTNPALHMLYVHWAMWNLKDLKSCLRKLNKTSQSTMFGSKQAIQREIQKLVETDPAYRHAAALLFAGVQPLPRHVNSPRYPLISEVEESEIKAKNMPKCGCTGTFYSIVTEGVPTIKCFGCYGPPENAVKVSDKYKCPCGMSECCKNLLDDNQVTKVSGKDKCDCGMPDGSCVA